MYIAQPLNGTALAHGNFVHSKLQDGCTINVVQLDPAYSSVHW